MIIVAVSGGVDSMVLLDKLYKEKKDIVVAHVNYQKRIDSYMDEIVIKAYLKNKNIIFEKKVVNKDEYTSDNFQKQARLIRYDFFKSLANKYNTKEIYIAHHMDDFLETYLFQINRGGLYDYYGIKAKSKYQGLIIHRPLLKMYKDEIIKYAKESNIEYHEDSSNSMLIYTRNINRNRLKKISKEKKEIMYQEIMSKNDMITHEKNNVNRLINQKIFSIDEFNKLNINEKRRLIFSLSKKYDISTKCLDDLIGQISTVKSLKVTFLDTTIAKAYDIIYLLRTDLNDYKFIVESEDDYLKYYIFFKENYNLIINKIHLDYPYIIRNYSKNDLKKLEVEHSKFRKKIKKNKIPFFLREYLPVVEKDGKVIDFIYKNMR